MKLLLPFAAINLAVCVALVSCACYLRLGERKPIDFYMRTLHASEGPVEPAENLTLLFDYAGDPLFNEELTYIDVYGSVSSCVFHVYTFNNKTIRVSLTSEEPLRSLTGNMTIYGIRWAN
ncbi:uncharacterized protein LOC120428744 [Culex pipiens pallens]|uniref:uncharacterized protein LOC120428744 n=1 Tax=Culex pipiens pallens TaxID=42434 RepID=UPI00195335AA|nr:uncharacterized protein LOC120428744 [Culex pipiens pallens]